ncbi:MAG: hypothetical protein SNG10_05465 [Rikenellaceae bacterium]
MARQIVTLLAIIFAHVAQAQSLEQFKSKLSQPSQSGARVTITESDQAQSALRRISVQPDKSNFLGYRIGIFFDNGPTARAKADEAKILFQQNFPTEEVYMVYENPYFKVSAGNCVTQEEAVIMLERIQKIFPKAYLMREQMSVEDIIITPIVEVDSLLTR